MKQLFFAACVLVVCNLSAQTNNIYRSGGISVTVGAPTFIPGMSGNIVAIDSVTGIWYINRQRHSNDWLSMGQRIEQIAGCAAPAYTPNKYNSDIVINACSPPEMYYHAGAGVWELLNAGGGGGATNLTFSGASSPVTLNSSTGNDVTIAAGPGVSLTATSGNMNIINSAPDQTVSLTGAGINVVTGTYPTFTITGTEVDGSVSNEIQALSFVEPNLSLSVGGGTVDLSGLTPTTEETQDLVGAMVTGNTETLISVTYDDTGGKLDFAVVATLSSYTNDAGFLTAAITSINSLSGASQTIAAGTSGTDFAVSSVGSTHTLNLPTASAVNRGALSTADWSTFNAKQPAGNYITALTGDVTASGPGSVAATIANSAVTLAKMADVATGTVFYRTTAGTGAPEVQTLATLKTDLLLTGTNSGDVTLSGENYISIAGQVITAAAVNLSGTHVTGTLAAARFGTLTGDVTTAGGSYSTTIANNAVTSAKIASNAVTGDKIAMGSDAPGDIIYYNGTDYVRLPVGTALQQLRVNAGATAPEWATIAGGGITSLNALTGATQTFAVGTAGTDFAITSSGTTHTFDIPTASGSNRGALSSADWTTFNSKGDVLQNGNSFAASMVIGTNDQNTFAIETNTVTRATVTGGASTGGAWTFDNITANTSTVEDVFNVRANSTGTATTGFGGGILFQGESSTTDNRDLARIAARWKTATDASRVSSLDIYTTISQALVRTAFFDNTVGTGSLSIGSSSAAVYSREGITTSVPFTVGNSSSQLTLGGSTGTILINSTISSSSAIRINPSNTSASGIGGIAIGPTVDALQTSGTRNMMNFDYGFAPTSGTAVHNQLSFNSPFNQTGGANGITRGVYLNQTLTAVADFRGIEIAYSNANAKGIYQTGALTTNNIVGKTTFGATTAPTALVMLAAGTATANTAPLKFTTGTLLTAAEAGAVEFLTDAAYITTTTNTVRRMIVAGSTGRATAQSAANASVATYTLGATDATYEVSANVLVTTSSAEAFTVTVDFTDESNTARTATMNFQLVAGTIGTAINFANGAVPYTGLPLHIRCKASTAITIKSVGTFTGATYNIEGVIKQQG